jgi:hypothetical protein
VNWNNIYFTYILVSRNLSLCFICRRIQILQVSLRLLTHY